MPRWGMKLMAAAVLVLGVSSAAGATTLGANAGTPTIHAASGVTKLGTTTQPSGSTATVCSPGEVIGQRTDAPSLRYIVPAPGGQITQWSTNTTGAKAGTPLVLTVLKPIIGTTDMVVASDLELLPNPLPSGHVVTFTLPHPISVEAGDTFGLYAQSSTVFCYWAGGTVPTGDTLWGGASKNVPSSGDLIDYGTNVSGAGTTLDLSVQLVQTEDVGVTTTAGPSNAAAQRPALLSSTVSNAGPGTEPITFVDQVPAGLTVGSATAGDGTCSTSGQTVTCTISGLGAGQTVPVNIVVTPSAAGSYPNTVSVSSSLTDSNAGNDTASATLNSTAATATQACVVPKLKNTPAGIAKTVLKDLGCKVKTSKAHSRTIHKGNVIKTKPGAGHRAFGTTVKLIVSSGPSHR